MKKSLDLIPILSECFLFSSLTISELEEVAKFCLLKRIASQTNIFMQGDEAKAFYVVVHGKLSVYRVNPKGQEQVIHVHQDKDVVAEAAIFGNMDYPASCRTLKDSTVIQVPKDEFISYIQNHFPVTLKMMSAYSQRLRSFVMALESLALDEVYLRIIKYLSEHKKPQNECYVVELPFSKKEFASLLGTIPETLSRNLKKLKHIGAIEEKEDVIILKDSDLFS